MVKKIVSLMVLLLISIISVNATFYVDSNNIMQVECLLGEGITINGFLYPDVVGFNATIQTGCLYLVTSQWEENQIMDYYIDGYEPNTIIDTNTSNLYFTSSNSATPHTETITFGNNLIELNPVTFAIGNIIIYNGHSNLDLYAHLDRSGYSSTDLTQIQFNNFKSYTLYDEALTPEFSIEPYYYYYVYNDQTLVIEYSLIPKGYTFEAVTNLIEEGVGIIDSRTLTGISNGETAQATFSLDHKGVYYTQTMVYNVDYNYESNSDIYGNTNNKIYFNTTPFNYGELYYVPLLQNNLWDLPINNNTISKFNLLGQSFVGNGEIITNGSFYFSNYGNLAPYTQYDINVNLYKARYDEFNQYYDCQFIVDKNLETSLSQGFIEVDLINNPNPTLITFNMTPYFLQNNTPYCLTFTSNAEDGVNASNIAMYYEDTNPYNNPSGYFFKSSYAQFQETGVGDLAGFIYSKPAIYGCMNSSSTRYNPNATKDDFTCYPYYVSNLENNSVELPLNNDTHIGQSFVGNGETLKNGSFYMKNKFGITPLYDVNVEIYTPEIDMMGNYYCEWLSAKSMHTPISTGVIDRNLILNEVSLVSFQLTPYLLEQDRPYCMIFVTNSDDVVNLNDVIMFKETLNPNPTHNVDYLSGNQVYSFMQDLTSDLAGYVYSSSPQTYAIPEFTLGNSPDTLNYNDSTGLVDLHYQIYSSEPNTISVIEKLYKIVDIDFVLISSRQINNLVSNTEITQNYQVTTNGTYIFEVTLLNDLDNSYNYTTYSKDFLFENEVTPSGDNRGIMRRTMEDMGGAFAGFFNSLLPSVSSWLIVLTIISLCLLIAGVFVKGVQNKFK